MEEKKTVAEIKSILAESFGYVSMCWSETPKGVFESTKVTEKLDEVWSEIEQYINQFKQPLESGDVKNKLAYLFNHLEHNNDEIGAKQVEDILKLIDQPQPLTEKKYSEGEVVKIISDLIEGVEELNGEFQDGWDEQIKKGKELLKSLNKK